MGAVSKQTRESDGKGGISAHKAKRQKRGARNKKKNMRKNIDLQDVEQFLEDQETQRRTGGIVAEKQNEELFFMDTKPDDDAPKPAVGRKAKAKLKVPRHLQIIEATTAVKPVSNVKHKVQEPGAVTKKLVDRQAKRLTRKQLSAPPLAPVEPKSKDPTPIWDAQGRRVEDHQPLPDSHWLKPTDNPKVKHPGTPKAPEYAAVPAVEVAEPGASYNPSFEAHQELLKKALDVEEKLEKEKAALLARLPKKLTREQEYNNLMRELSAGLDDAKETRDEAVNEGDRESDDDDHETRGLLPAQAEPKTSAQRRKEQAAKDLERLKQVEKKRRAAEAEVFRVKSILKELKEAEIKAEEKRKRREEKKAEALKNPRRLSRYRHEEQKKEIKLTEELVGSLRELKPEGDVVKERLMSLHRRNILELRKPFKQKRKYKQKYYEKPQYKAFSLKALKEKIKSQRK